MISFTAFIAFVYNTQQAVNVNIHVLKRETYIMQLVQQMVTSYATHPISIR